MREYWESGMIIISIYFALSLIGLCLSLWIGTRTVSSGFRTGRIQAGAHRIFDRDTNPVAFYGIAAIWLMSILITGVSAIALLPVWLGQMRTV